MRPLEGKATVRSLNADAFFALVLQQLRIIHADSNPAKLLLEDCCDSLQMLEALVIMEELGAPISEDEIQFMKFLGDLYDHYVASYAHS